MNESSRHTDNGYSALAEADLRLLADRMFAAKNYVLAAALLEAVGDSLSTAESAKFRYARTHSDQGDVRFTNTAAILPILFRGYRGQTVADVLGVKLGDAAAVTAGRFVQVVYQPSFDPETILFLSLNEGRTALFIDAASSSLWDSASLSWNPEYAFRLPAEKGLLPISVYREQVIFDDDEAVQLWRRIAAISVEAAERDVRSLDGMRVEGCFRDGRSHDFNVHVARGGPGVELAKILFEAASEHARAPECVATLENIFGYFRGSGLPIKVFPGPPRTLRIFGRLGWSNDAVEALRKVLSAFSQDEPLIIDLSNFRSMGTLFHPEFNPLLQRSGITAWVRSQGADSHLREMSVDSTLVFDTITSAQLHVLGTQNEPRNAAPSEDPGAMAAQPARDPYGYS